MLGTINRLSVSDGKVWLSKHHLQSNYTACNIAHSGHVYYSLTHLLIPFYIIVETAAILLHNNIGNQKIHGTLSNELQRRLISSMHFYHTCHDTTTHSDLVVVYAIMGASQHQTICNVPIIYPSGSNPIFYPIASSIIHEAGSKCASLFHSIISWAVTLADEVHVGGIDGCLNTHLHLFWLWITAHRSFHCITSALSPAGK